MCVRPSDTHDSVFASHTSYRTPPVASRSARIGVREATQLALRCQADPVQWPLRRRPVDQPRHLVQRRAATGLAANTGKLFLSDPTSHHCCLENSGRNRNRTGGAPSIPVAHRSHDVSGRPGLVVGSFRVCHARLDGPTLPYVRGIGLPFAANRWPKASHTACDAIRSRKPS